MPSQEDQGEATEVHSTRELRQQGDRHSSERSVGGSLPPHWSAGNGMDGGLDAPSGANSVRVLF